MSEAQFDTWLDAKDYGRAAAWMVHAFTDDIFALCMSIVRDRATAEDLTQDVFSRAFTGLAGFRREAAPRTWLTRIAQNRCIDHLRSNHNASRVDEEPDTHASDDVLPADLLSRREDVERALAALDERERALIVLRFKNGLEYGELAVAFGLREGAVRMRVCRALQRMRTALETSVPMRSAALSRAPIAPSKARRRAAPASPAPSSRVPAARSRGAAVHPLSAYFSAQPVLTPQSGLRERLLTLIG